MLSSFINQTAANGNEIQSPRLNQFNPENHFGSGWIYISKCEKCCVAGPSLLRLQRIAAAAVKPLADPLWDQDKKFLKSICDNFSSVVILKSIKSCFTLYTRSSRGQWRAQAAAKTFMPLITVKGKLNPASSSSWIYFGVKIAVITLTSFQWIKMSPGFIWLWIVLQFEDRRGFCECECHQETMAWNELLMCLVTSWSNHRVSMRSMGARGCKLTLH